MSDITPARKLFDLLISRDFDPEMLDSSGRPAPDPAESEIFSFDFRARSGKDYGTVVIMLGEDNNLEIYCSDNVGRSMEGDDKNDWFAFLEQLKNFSTRNFMSFGIKNLNRLRYSMQGQAAIREGLFESWTGNRTTSWNGAPTEARLMIRHKKNIGEGDARFRHIESLFIETADSERYRLPFTSLTAGRAMLEHVRQGGRPYDPRGNHIAEMVTELSVLSRFRRANAGQIFEGDTAQLVEQVQEYQANLQRSLKGLGTRTGYAAYFESWSPADISEQDVVIESLKSLFVKQTIDTRIESALPLLAKIQQQGTEMKEANIFEAWAERLVEGTWQLPDTPEKQAELLELMSQDLPVGADATNVTEQLYNLLGDDELFDQLEALAEQDANADARQVIYDRMQMLSDHPEVLRVIEQLQIDPTAEMNPNEATPADLGSSEMDDAEHVPGAQGNINRLAESRMLDEDGSTLEHILNRFKYEVREFEQGGDLDKHLYHALEDYYRDLGEIPYPILNGDEGDPMEWVAQNLESHLRGGGIVGGTDWGAEDRGLERESVMHGDYAEEKSRMRKMAGLTDEEKDVTTAGEKILGMTTGGALGAVAGGLAAGPVGAAVGGIVGAGLGNKVAQRAGNKNVANNLNAGANDFKQNTEEGEINKSARKIGTGIADVFNAPSDLVASTASKIWHGDSEHPDIDEGIVDTIKGLAGIKPAQPEPGKEGSRAMKTVGQQSMPAMSTADLSKTLDAPNSPTAPGFSNSMIEDDKKDKDSSVAPTVAGAALGGAAGYTAAGGDLIGDIGKLFKDTKVPTPTPAEIASGTNAMGDIAGSVFEKDETDEGWKGQLAGGTVGTLAGTAAGSSLGPIGAAIGGAAGGTAGQMIGDKLGGSEEDESPLAGKYGHAGKLKEVGKDTSFLDRLKELSGLKR